MFTDFTMARLKGLIRDNDPGADGASMPPEVFAAWTRGGEAFGKFVLLGEMGRGGTSVVHRAWQVDLKREVALKVVSGVDPEMRDRFRREVEVAGRLSHPGILPVFESGESGGSLWLSMPLVTGQTLDRCGLGVMEAAQSIAAAARAVAAAHAAGVVHRDLKPRNLMRDAHGVRVMDFGLARSGGEATQISHTGQILGTPNYMSPEQAAGRVADERSDVYGLGATLYRLVTGKAPYEGGSLQEFLVSIAGGDPQWPSTLAALPPDLETIILKSMDRDPRRRYGGAAALAEDLERFVAGAPIVARRSSFFLRAWRWSLARKAAAVLLLALAAAATLAALDQGEPEEPRRGPEPRPGETRARQSPAELAAGRMIAEAQGLRDQRELPAAIAVLERAQQLYPEADAVWSFCAACRIDLRQWPQAADDLGRAIQLRPTDVYLLETRGQCRMMSGDLEAALADYNQGLTLQPQAAGCLVGRARVYTLQGKQDLARADLNEAVALLPENLWVRTARGTFEYQMERYAASVADFEEAVRIGGEQPELLRKRGQSRLKAGDAAGALADLLKAVYLDPKLHDESELEILDCRRLLAMRGWK